MLMRMAAFEHVRALGEVHDHLTATELKPGFVFDGERVPLVNPQRGIFKPQQMQFLLSIKTVFPKPGGKVWYDDQREVHRQIFEGDETVDYAFMGQDPAAADNRWLREAFENQIAIIYFLGIAPGRYQAMLPAFISGWDGKALKACVAFGAPNQETLAPPETALERRYALRAVKQRLATKRRSVRPSSPPIRAVAPCRAFPSRSCSMRPTSSRTKTKRLGSGKEVAQIGAAIGREFSYALLAAVMRKPEAELASALDRLIAAGLLFRQGVPPHASYLFKHALVQDAAYGTLLREPRRTLHTRIAETLESQFAETAENQPELLARHCTDAGLIEKAARLWGKAGQQSLARSALVEATTQLNCALAQITALPATPALRREQIKLQVALITPLIHVKGYAAAETKAAAEQARLLIEQAEALGEPSEDPLLLFSVLYGFWVANVVAFNGDAMRDLAAQLLALAEKQRATVPLMIAHRLIGTSLLFTGDIAEGRAHLDRAIALYDPAEHRPLATRFGQDTRVTILSQRPRSFRRTR
jgi:hypothetical protein